MIAKLEQLKDAGQDFEWYPTTDEMIHEIARRLNNVDSILDVGAGDGRVLTGLVDARRKILVRTASDDYERERFASWTGPDLYAIEKAGIHIENMPPEIAMVGTDFESQTLIDKQVDVVFSNPPYSQYEPWACKIIKEAFCNDLYLILPSRWIKSEAINYALRLRNAEAKVIWSGDFLNAERQARARVDILKIDLNKNRNGDCWSRTEKQDPFDSWFSETFPEVANMKEDQDHETPKQRISSELLKGYNLVDRLTELYRQELDKMNADYKALCEINPRVFKTVGVTASQVRDGLKSSIKGLKNLYWQELFDHLDKVKQRLTHESREDFVKKISSAVHVDFTHENVYAVVLWVLKNANHYMDSQLCALFKTLTTPEHIRNYKSNQRTWDKNAWRFMQEQKPTHYCLDYRIITVQHRGIFDAEWGQYDYPGHLHKNCHIIIEDIITVANNLGYSCTLDKPSTEREWASGRPHIFRLDNGQTLMRVKAFKNGNLHMQLHQDFIRALNVEASRLLGWIRTPQEAAEEMPGIDFNFASLHFSTNLQFTPSDCKRLTA